MLERRTFIVRVHAHNQLPIVEDVSTRAQIRLPDLAAIPDELRRRLHSTDDVAMELPEGLWTPPEQRA